MILKIIISLLNNSSKGGSIQYQQFCDLHQQIARMILAGRKKFTKESCVRMLGNKYG